MVVSCSIVGCKNRFKKGEINLYSVPKVRTNNGERWRVKSALRRQKWINAINRKDLLKKDNLDNVRVCYKHFITGRAAKLEEDSHPDWVPSINLDGRQDKPPSRKLRALERYHRVQERRNSSLMLEIKKKYGEDTCVVPDCNNVGVCKEGIRYYHLPHNKDHFNKWKSQLLESPKTLPLLTRKNMVCSDHFLDSDYVTNDVGLKLWFKVGAYPSVFPWNKDDIEILPVDNFLNEELEVFDGNHVRSLNITDISRETGIDDEDDNNHDNEGNWSEDNDNTMDLTDESSVMEPEVELILPHSAPEFVEDKSKLSMLQLLLQGENEDCCGVLTCKKKSGQGVILHTIPQGNALIIVTDIHGEQQYVNLAKAWRDLAQIKNTDKICSAHFLPEDYIPGLNWVLQPNACPSINLPSNLQQATYSIQKPQIPALVDISSQDCSQNSSANEINKEQNLDITTLCRICISSCGEDAVPIFSVFSYEHRIQQKILKFLGLKVQGYDAEMPLKICKSCFLKLEGCQQFADLAINNNKKLKQLVAKQKEKGASEPVLQKRATEEAEPNLTTPDDDDDDDSVCLEVDMEEEKEETQQEKQKENTKGKKRCLSLNKPCPYCPQIYNRRSTLDKHLSKNHNIFVCHKCNLEFRDRNNYDKHVIDVHCTTCKLCTTKVMDTALQTHLKESHATLLPKYIALKKMRYERIKCKLCDKVSAYKRSAKKHYFWYHQVYACDVCLKTFPTLEEQDNHLQEVHMISCSYCNEQFYTANRFQRHVNKEHSNEKSKNKCQIEKSSEQVFECQYCDKSLSTIFNVKQHNFWNHSKYTCLVCLSTFNSAELEETHFISHGHICVWCEVKYRSDEELSEHMQCVHPGHNKTFCCEKCGDCFYEKQELREHRFSHNISKESQLHLCDVCGKTFVSSNSLNQHSMSHKTSEDKQKECHICYKRFFFESQLRNHMSSHSSNDMDNKKPHTCSYCKKTFVNFATLQNHINQNHNDVMCKYCDFSFKNKDDLKHHLKHAHLCF